MKRINFSLFAALAIASAQTADLAPIVSKAVSRTVDLPGEFLPFQSVSIHAKIRAKIPFVDHDRAMDHDIATVVDMIRTDTLLNDITSAPDNTGLGEGTDLAEAGTYDNET